MNTVLSEARKFGLKIINFNIRSFHRNISSFLCFLESTNFSADILILTESWLTVDNVNCANIDGYRSYHTLRKTGRSGGVSIFCRNKFNVNIIENLCLANDHIESCSVKIKEGDIEYFIMGIYRPHSGTKLDFINFFSNFFETSAFRSNSNIFFCW